MKYCITCMRQNTLKPKKYYSNLSTSYIEDIYIASHSPAQTIGLATLSEDCLGIVQVATSCGNMGCVPWTHSV